MKQIFNITFLLSFIWIAIYAYFYYILGWEGSKDLLISFTNKTWADKDFFKEFYYYMGLFLSLFFLPFSLMMSGKMHMWYMFLIWSFIFGWVAYSVEMMRIPFIIPTLVFFGIFWFFTITPKIKWRKLAKLKIEWIHAKAKFINTVTDYSVKINGRPRIKAIADVVNPHTWKLIRIESEWSFDPYFSINLSEELDVYFDRHDTNKYMIDL